VFVGGGYVGLHCALELERSLPPGAAELVLISEDNFMLYWPLLVEVGSGALDARHVAMPLRRTLHRTEVLTGTVTAIDSDRRCVRLAPYRGREYELSFDHLVVGLGSETRVMPVPGLAEHAVGFKSVAEAIHLRNQVLSRLEVAQSTSDAEARRRALTFVFVGGGYTGVEVTAELEDLARSATRWFPRVRPEDMRWLLIEATDRILPEVRPSLAKYALAELRARRIDVRLETQLESALDGCLELSDGTSLEADTLVWMAGVRPHPLVANSGLARDDQGRLRVDACLRANGADGVWAAGDCAAVPDVLEGGTCPPTAQHAVREARQLAVNLIRAIDGRPPEPFQYQSLGQLITLGRHKGVAEIRGRTLRGLPAWLARRAYYVAQTPSLERRSRMVADWLVELPFSRDPVQLGSAEHPDVPLSAAAR
jgi:NADH:quinone reductase (non-electrogenic)